VPWTSSSIALLASAALLLLAPAAHAQTPLPPGQIAQVAGQPITKAEYDRRYRTALYTWGQPSAESLTLDQAAILRSQVVQSLVERHWISGEAALRGLTVTTAQVNAEYRRQKRQSYPKEKDFRRFLRTSRQTIADLKQGVRLGMLEERLRADVAGDARTARGRTLRLDRFLTDFTARWRSQTVCGVGFTLERECGSVVPLST
jgi:foldase protein PrsA